MCSENIVPVRHSSEDTAVTARRGKWSQAGVPHKGSHADSRYAPVCCSHLRARGRAAVSSYYMSIVGHKTESIYRRYAIVDEAMQREAAARLNAWAQVAFSIATASVKRLRQTSR